MANEILTKEQPVEVADDTRRITLGIPAACIVNERRFPLTPEGAAQLCERGFEVRMEAGAADVIHFNDEAYRRHGVKIVSRAEALDCDIVIHLPALKTADAECMHKGAILMTLLDAAEQQPEAVRALLKRDIISIALDLIVDPAGNLPFADILSEVDGRAAIATASSLLADPLLGKGILLGGVAGIVPCEVTVIGSGIAARAATRSALGLGATVRMFDNDVYSLRDALHDLGGQNVIGSSLHPRVFANALRSADVVVATPTRYPLEVGADMVSEMKRGVIAFDLGQTGMPPAFPSLQRVDLAVTPPVSDNPNYAVRICYVNAGSAVPRTASMALSTTLLTLFDDIMVCDGFRNAIHFNTGIRAAVYTFRGKVVNKLIGTRCGLTSFDINLFIQFS